MKRNHLMFLEDVLESMNRIETYLTGVTYNQFIENQLIIDATIRNLEVIGEASKYIPEEIKERYPMIPWRKMTGLRNILIHEYFGIDEENVWEIASNNLPQTKQEIEKIIKDLKE
jgi:uncharacterized protein with HEPN domain